MRTNHISSGDVATFINMLPQKHQIIFKLGVTTGLRISDIVRLKVKDIEKVRPTIREQKTGKSKRIYIKKEIREEIEKICSMKNKEDYIFSTQSKGGHITRQAVFKAFKRASKKRGIDYNIATHSMRKTYAYKLYKKGKTFKYIQNKLNHANVCDTLLYIVDEKKG